MSGLVIGSRGSALALWQSRWVAGELEKLGHTTRIEIIKTTGDKITDVALSKVGTKGLFTKELEEALLDRRIDLAVHSLKDMPTDLPRGLVLAATPVREDARDAIVGKKVADLPRGARVGTSSLRRMAQLKALRPDLAIESIRGNVDTRLRKLDEGQFDAILLAAAGLNRLGLADRIAERLSIEAMCPAVGQGALAVETREEATPVAALDHQPTRDAVTAERAVLNGLGGGCQVPMGAHAWLDGDQLHIRAAVISPEGGAPLIRTAHGPASQAQALGEELSRELLAAGADDILAAVYGA